MTMLRSILSAGVLAALAAGAAHAAEITLFKQPNFSGDKLTLREDTTSLAGAGFQDQVSSIVVHSGRWQFCTQPDFQGDCVVLERGQYPQLAQQLNHRVESAREVAPIARNDRFERDRYADNRGGERRYREGGYERGAVELFPGPDFRGPALRLDHDVDALDERAFGNGVSSLVIHEGRWQACTRPGFEGRCRVYEPGEYADLGRQDNRISSLRRIG